MYSRQEMNCIKLIGNTIVFLKIILEYISNLARLGIECVNNHYKTITENEKRG